MALTYSFYISTKLAPESLMRALLLSLGLPWDPNEGCWASTDNFDVGVGPVDARSREISAERWGFEPDMNLFFKTSADVDIPAQEQIVQGTLAICRATAGNAVLLFNGEQILFIRKAGAIYVNTLYWKGNYSLFSPPYALKAFKVDDPPF